MVLSLFFEPHSAAQPARAQHANERTPISDGYGIVDATGTVATFGGSGFRGDLSSAASAPIVGISATPDGKGYWLVNSSGSVFGYGDATFYGSAGAGSVNGSIVGMAVAHGGKGYWLASSSGQVLAFGDATAYGSMAGKTLAAPIVGISATPDGSGYILVGSDGGVFNFGDAIFEGSDVNPAEPPTEPAGFTDPDPRVVGITYLSPGEVQTSTGPIKVSYFGDSLAWLDEIYSSSVAGSYEVSVGDAATPGCGIVGDGELSTSGSGVTDPPPACADWYQRMTQALASEHPDVVVIELGYWESQPHLWDGSWVTLTGSALYAATVQYNLARLVALIKSYSAVPVLLTSPYYGDGTSDAQVDAWNRIVNTVATTSGVSDLDLHSLLDPSGSYQGSVDGVTARTSDGVHLTLEGVTQVIDPWLLPTLERIGETAR